MSDSEGVGFSNPGLQVQNSAELRSPVVGSPLPVGAEPLAQSHGVPNGFVPPPGRALRNSSAANSQFDQHSSFQNAINTLCMALPFVQRILPLFESKFATSASTGLAPGPQAVVPAPPINLEPIEESLAELQTQQHDLRSQIQDQNSSLKRVEDHLEMVREATDRNTLEQQELLEDLKGYSNKIKMFTFYALGLLAISILLNLVMFLHIRRVLP